MRGKQQSSEKTRVNNELCGILRRFSLKQIKLNSHKNIVRTRTLYRVRSVVTSLSNSSLVFG